MFENMRTTDHKITSESVNHLDVLLSGVQALNLMTLATAATLRIIENVGGREPGLSNERYVDLAAEISEDVHGQISALTGLMDKYRVKMLGLGEELTALSPSDDKIPDTFLLLMERCDDAMSTFSAIMGLAAEKKVEFGSKATEVDEAMRASRRRRGLPEEM